MWTANSARFCQRFQVPLPIIQAPMAGSPANSALVVAVSRVGAMGSLGAGYMTPKVLRATIRDIKTSGASHFSVNVFSPPIGVERGVVSAPARERLAAIAANAGIENLDFAPATPDNLPGQIRVLCEERVPIVSTTFGLLPDEHFGRLKEQKALLIATATSVGEAIAIEKAGYDAVVAQGAEAGGHRGSFLPASELPLVGTMALVPQIVDAVSIPVIASGGIMDGRGVIASLLLGASAVQMGTAFLTTSESGAEDVWKEALMQGDETETTLTRAFSGKAARGLKNGFIEAMAEFEDEVASYPLQNQITNPIRNQAKKSGNADNMSLWSGQGLRLTRRMDAADLIETLKAEVSQTLGTLQ